MSSIRRRPLVAGVFLAVAIAGAAFAYWTAGGSGTGTASVDDTQALTANQTYVVQPMYPGDSPQTLSGNFDNPNAGPIYVSTVTASIASVVKDVNAPAGTCDASDFTLANATMNVNAQVPSGNSVGSWSGATIKFNNKANANQNACKNATVNLAYSIGA
jgi:hypothetical protein